MKTSSTLLVLALLGVACGSDEFDVPKPFSGSLPDNPRSCGDVREKAAANSSQVLIDGAPAECVGEGVACSVADLPGFSGVCVTGVPNAVCGGGLWSIRCDLDAGNTTPLDGGADG